MNKYDPQTTRTNVSEYSSVTYSNCPSNQPKLKILSHTKHKDKDEVRKRETDLSSPQSLSKLDAVWKAQTLTPPLFRAAFDSSYRRLRSVKKKTCCEVTFKETPPVPRNYKAKIVSRGGGSNSIIL